MIDPPLIPVDRDPTPRDFGLRFANNAIETPRVLVDIAAQHGAKTGLGLLSLAEVFPTALANALGWAAADVGVAACNLRNSFAADRPLSERRPVWFGAGPSSDAAK